MPFPPSMRRGGTLCRIGAVVWHVLDAVVGVSEAPFSGTPGVGSCGAHVPSVSHLVEKGDKLSPFTPGSLREPNNYGPLRACVSSFVVDCDTRKTSF